MQKSEMISLRWKFLGLFIASILATAALLLIGYALASFLILVPGINAPFRWTVNGVGSVPVTAVAGIVLFPFCYYWISNPLIRRFERIESGLREIAEGRFDHVIPDAANDEAGSIAQGINRMTGEWSLYLQEIKAGLEEIAKGKFDHEIPVQEDSELGTIARSINQMTAQLRRSIREERIAEQTKNDLITGVSHDLRTPLTSILGFLELIEQDRYRDEVELRYYVDIAYDKTLSLRKLIDDLFEYTRINNGMPLQTAVLDMNGFIRQLAEEFVPTFEREGMLLRVDAEDGDLPVLADGDQLARAYENLIANALQYGKEGVYVDIRVASEDGQVVVQVANCGNPIPEADLPFIFDRFYRGDRSRSKETGGTGLGLAIAKSIIELHDGRILARSDRERTVFETQLPLHS